MDNNRGLLLFGFGCAAGVLGALLLTSKSSHEIAAFLRWKAEEGAKNLKEDADILGHAVTNAAERGRRAARHQSENLTAAVEAAKQAYREAQETTP